MSRTVCFPALRPLVFGQRSDSSGANLLLLQGVEWSYSGQRENWLHSSRRLQVPARRRIQPWVLVRKTPRRRSSAAFTLSELNIIAPDAGTCAGRPGLADRLPGLVERRLIGCAFDADVIEAETRTMRPVAIAPTVDSSVLGIMVDFAKSVPHYLEPGGWNENTLVHVEARLAETPCHAIRPDDRVISPERKARELLRAKWSG